MGKAGRLAAGRPQVKENGLAAPARVGHAGARWPIPPTSLPGTTRFHGRRQSPDPARHRSAPARRTARADRRRASARCASCSTSTPTTPLAAGSPPRSTAAARRGVAVAVIVDGFGSAIDDALLRRAGERGRLGLPLLAALRPPLPAAQPPEAGARRRAADHHRRLQRRGRLFRHAGRSGVARSRSARRGARGRAAGRLFRCAAGDWITGPRAEGPPAQPHAGALQRDRRPAALADRRSDPQALALGTHACAPTCARPTDRHHRRLFHAQPHDAAPDQARRPRGSEVRVVTAVQIRQHRHDRRRPLHLRGPVAQGRAHLRIPADQAAHQALRRSTTPSISARPISTCAACSSTWS